MIYMPIKYTIRIVVFTLTTTPTNLLIHSLQIYKLFVLITSKTTVSARSFQIKRAGQEPCPELRKTSLKEVNAHRFQIRSSGQESRLHKIF